MKSLLTNRTKSVITYSYMHNGMIQTGIEKILDGISYDVALKNFIVHIVDSNDEMKQVKKTLTDFDGGYSIKEKNKFSFVDCNGDKHEYIITDFDILSPMAVTVVLNTNGKVIGVAGLPRDCHVFVKQDCVITTAKTL